MNWCVRWKRTLQINHYKCAHTHTHAHRMFVRSLYLSLMRSSPTTPISRLGLSFAMTWFSSRVVIITNSDTTIFLGYFFCNKHCANQWMYVANDRVCERMNVYFPFDSVITQLKCIEMITRHFQRNVHSMRILSESLLWILINSIRSHTCALHELQLTLFTQKNGNSTMLKCLRSSSEFDSLSGKFT